MMKAIKMKSERLLVTVIMLIPALLFGQESISSVFSGMLERYSDFASYQAHFVVYSKAEGHSEVISEGSTAQAEGFLHTKIGDVETILANGLQVIADHEDQQVYVAPFSLDLKDTSEPDFQEYHHALETGRLTFQLIGKTGDVLRFAVTLNDEPGPTFGIDTSNYALVEYSYEVVDPMGETTTYQVLYSDIVFDDMTVTKAFHWRRIIRDRGGSIVLTGPFKIYSLIDKTGN